VSRYEIEIRKNGMWPTRWSWAVRRRDGDYGFRLGQAFTKDRARRKALKAKRSMEVDDVKVVHE